jgi:hypothetical protein
MAYYEDLGACDYFGTGEARLLAIGWLEAGRPYAEGPVSRGFFESLARLAIHPWQPVVMAGRHACPFCIFTGGPAEIRAGDTSVQLGVSNVFVPAADAVYVAPSLVLHYIDAHGYAPPEPFRRAVEACPAMRSMDYLKAIQKHGLTRLRP